jgi:hypothetical protein
LVSYLTANASLVSGPPEIEPGEFMNEFDDVKYINCRESIDFQIEMLTGDKGCSFITLVRDSRGMYLAISKFPNEYYKDFLGNCKAGIDQLMQVIGRDSEFDGVKLPGEKND